MTTKNDHAAALSRALHEGAHAAAVERTGGPAPCELLARDYRAFLATLDVDVVRALLDYLPGIAAPWRVVEMRAGKPTKLARAEHGGGDYATVRAVRGKWEVRVGGLLFDCADGPGLFASEEDARAAADARLREDGVLLEEGT